MLIYNIKTQVKLDLGYNPLIFDGLWAFYKKHSTKIGVRSITFETTESIRFIFGMLIYNFKTQVKFDLGYNPQIFDGVIGLL